MVKAVIDTNCLRASIPHRSPFYQLYLDFRDKKFQWYVSNEILLEYEEVLTKTYSANTAREVLHRLSVASNTVFAEPSYKWNLIESDPDDNKFADLAVCTNCDFLVTNDRDFGILKELPFPKVRVINLESFLNFLESIEG